MKFLNSSLIIILFAISFSACSVSKESRTMKRNINGNWVLETIVTEGATGKIKDKIFNEADFSCFIGSEWNFVSKNNRCCYSIIDKQKDCPVIKRFISWSFSGAKVALPAFSFKRLDDKNYPMNNEPGFNLTITQLDKKELKLKADIIFEGHPATIIYNFVKNDPL